MEAMIQQPRDTKGWFRPRTRAAPPPVLNDKAFVILELDRPTGRMKVDLEFAYPLEALAMCQRGAEVIEEVIESRQADE